jgi:TonB family protein
MSLKKCLIAASIAFSIAAITAATAQPNSATTDAQINWRLVESLRAGRFAAGVEVSSDRRLRVIAAVDNTRLVGPELAMDTVTKWNTWLFSQLDNPTSREYVLGNAVLVQPFLAEGGNVGFLLTVADTVGASKEVIVDKGTLENFLDLLESGVVAARTLTDNELHKSGQIVATPVALAKPYTAAYPRNARLVGASGMALMQFVVDTTGHARKSSITAIEATYTDFRDAAASAVMDMEFTPATMDGHKIERLVQIPFNFTLHNTLPISAFSVPVRRTR